MKKFIVTAMALSLYCAGITSAKAALVEHDYDPAKPYVTTPWYEAYGAENFKADDTFITGMRPHHAGALSMSKDYLASDKKTSHRLQKLAKSIIDNQSFEILMLDEVEKRIDKIDFSARQGRKMHIVAVIGLSQRERFARSPIPSLFTLAKDTVSEEDVRFAKAMIIHHEAALTMCDTYLDDPASTNGYLERMCLDIKRDQTQEITLMKDIIADYAGNPDDVTVKPGMVHGMEGMMDHDAMDHDM